MTKAVVVLALAWALAVVAFAAAFDLNQLPPSTPDESACDDDPSDDGAHDPVLRILDAAEVVTECECTPVNADPPCRTASDVENAASTFQPVSQRGHTDSSECKSLHGDVLIDIPDIAVPHGISLGARIELARQHSRKYNSIPLKNLTPRSRFFMRSLKALTVCFDRHCRKSDDEFASRHPSFRKSFRAFHTKFCLGGATCDFERNGKRRIVDNEFHRKKAKEATVVARTVSWKSSPNPDYEDLIRKVRDQLAQYGQVRCTDMTGPTRIVLNSARHLLHCFEVHCKKNVNLFAERHPVISVGQFAALNCNSFEERCSYLEMREVKRRLRERQKLQKRKMRA